jgi:hypothetical protein
MPLEDAPFYGPKWSKYPKKDVNKPHGFHGFAMEKVAQICGV